MKKITVRLHIFSHGCESCYLATIMYMRIHGITFLFFSYVSICCNFLVHLQYFILVFHNITFRMFMIQTDSIKIQYEILHFTWYHNIKLYWMGYYIMPNSLNKWIIDYWSTKLIIDYFHGIKLIYISEWIYQWICIPKYKNITKNIWGSSIVICISRR